MAETKTFKNKKNCMFCAEHIEKIDYKDIRLLSKFVTERGKIIPARISATCAKHQRKLSKAIHRARFLALMPFVSE